MRLYSLLSKEFVNLLEVRVYLASLVALSTGDGLPKKPLQRVYL